MNEKTSWGGVAEWYDDLVESEDSYQKNVILPNLLRIVGPKSGMAILDIACGQGYFSRAFAQDGATVTGCDISKELIDIAKKKASETELTGDTEYFVSKSHEFISKIEGLDGSVGYFDVVTIVLAIQNIEKMSETIAEASKALKKGGRLILVLNHPAFRIPASSSWQWDEAGKKQYRRIDSYMSESRTNIDMEPGKKSDKEFTVSFHRPLQSYTKALSKSGLVITRMEEWISHKKSEKGPKQAEEDRMRKEIPLFLCLESTKL